MKFKEHKKKLYEPYNFKNTMRLTRLLSHKFSLCSPKLHCNYVSAY